MKSEERIFFPDSFPDVAIMPTTSSNGASPIHVRTKRLSKDDVPLNKDRTSEGQPKMPQSFSCPLESQHVGKELLNVNVSLPIDAVFTLLFVQEQFMTDVLTNKKTLDVTATSWQEQDGTKIRQMTYTMALPPSNISPKVSYVTENQVLQPQSVPGDVYIVESEVLNSGIPYSEAFTVIKHFCLTRQEDGSTNVVSWVSVKYKKTVWGFVKSMIEKNTYIGVDIIFQEIASQLSVEAEKINNPSLGKKRRRTAHANAKTKSQTSATEVKSKQTQDQVDSEKPSRKGLALFMLIALISLGVANIYIYQKLSHLENRGVNSSTRIPIPSVRFQLGGERSWEAVARILHKHQELQDSQLGEWKNQVSKASQNLLEAQEALQWMMDKIIQHEHDLREALQEQGDQLKTEWTKAEERKEKQLEHIANEDFTMQRKGDRHSEFAIKSSEL